MVVKVPRYMAIGIEPDGVTENGPYIADPVLASALPAAPDHQLAIGSFVEVEVNGGTDNSGTVTLTGVVNGASTTEDFVFAGPGGALTQPLRVKGSKLFTSITGHTQVGLDEATNATIGIRVSDRVFVDYMTESIHGENTIIKSEKNVRDRFSRKSNTGLFKIGGEFDLEVDPTNGLLEILMLAFGLPISVTPVSGIEIETAAGVGSTVPAINITGGAKRLIIIVNSITGSGTITVTGTVNGGADTDAVAISGTGTFFTTKAFDAGSLTDYTASAGITAIDYDVQQADAYDWLFEPCDRLPSAFLRIVKDEIAEREVQGLKANSVEISLKTEETVVAKLGVDGRTEQENVVGTPSFSDLLPFIFHKSSIKRDGVNYEVPMEMVPKIENTLNLRKRSGSRFLRDIRVEGGKAALPFKFLFEDHDAYRRFWGGASALSPQAQLTAQNFEITLDSFEEIFVGGATYKMIIDMHRAFFDDMAEDVNERNVIESSGNAYLEVDNTEDVAISITITTSAAA